MYLTQLPSGGEKCGFSLKLKIFQIDGTGPAPSLYTKYYRACIISVLQTLSSNLTSFYGIIIHSGAITLLLCLLLFLCHPSNHGIQSQHNYTDKPSCYLRSCQFCPILLALLLNLAYGSSILWATNTGNASIVVRLPRCATFLFSTYYDCLCTLR